VADVPAPHELLAGIPDPWRRWLTLRRARRWASAVRFARRHNSRLKADAPAVSFYPMRIGPTAALAHVVGRLGVRIADFGTPVELVVAWETGTWLPASAVARLPSSALNRACVDISKNTVDRVWSEVSGHSISVDPLSWQGPLVVKPVINGVRGGRIVAGPLAHRRADVVYQRLIDCRLDGRVHTLRPMVFEGRLLVVYEKRRAAADWFSGREEVAVRRGDEVLSRAEQEQLLRFSRALGLDYGELDVVRDNGSGLIYAVDANRTPIRPRGLAPADEDAAFGPLAQALAARIERRGG
jgi:hypothetical protein